MKFVILYLCLVCIVAYAINSSLTSEENKNYKLHIKFKKLYETTGSPKYKELSIHYHQEWVNETTDG